MIGALKLTNVENMCPVMFCVRTSLKSIFLRSAITDTILEHALFLKLRIFDMLPKNSSDYCIKQTKKKTEHKNA